MGSGNEILVVGALTFYGLLNDSGTTPPSPSGRTGDLAGCVGCGGPPAEYPAAIGVVCPFALTRTTIDVSSGVLRATR